MTHIAPNEARGKPIPARRMLLVSLSNPLARPALAIREYTDSRRVEWSVWDVTPAQMHPLTRDEVFLGEMHDGWLVFESKREKRRLNAPYPHDWVDFDIHQLEELCAKASPVLRRRQKSPSGE